MALTVLLWSRADAQDINGPTAQGPSVAATSSAAKASGLAPAEDRRQCAACQPPRLADGPAQSTPSLSTPPGVRYALARQEEHADAPAAGDRPCQPLRVTFCRWLH